MDGRSLLSNDTSRSAYLYDARRAAPCLQDRFFDFPHAKDGLSFPSNDTSRPGRIYDITGAKDGRSLRTTTTPAAAKPAAPAQIPEDAITHGHGRKLQTRRFESKIKNTTRKTRHNRKLKGEKTNEFE